MSALVPYASPEAAEQRAVAIRQELNRRPADDVIRAWLEYVSVAVARPRPTDDEIVTLTGILLDGEYPAAVFNPTTRREAARKFKYWPSAAEIWDLLAPHIEAMGAELPGLDRIVRNARRQPLGPAREAFGYDPGPATPRPSQEARPASKLTTQSDAEAQRQADESQRAQLARLAAMGVDITRKRTLTEPPVRQDNSTTPEPAAPKRKRRQFAVVGE
jgi:hypothetical protein